MIFTKKELTQILKDNIDEIVDLKEDIFAYVCLPEKNGKIPVVINYFGSVQYYFEDIEDMVNFYNPEQEGFNKSIPYEESTLIGPFREKEGLVDILDYQCGKWVVLLSLKEEDIFDEIDIEEDDENSSSAWSVLRKYGNWEKYGGQDYGEEGEYVFNTIDPFTKKPIPIYADVWNESVDNRKRTYVVSYSPEKGHLTKEGEYFINAASVVLVEI